MISMSDADLAEISERLSLWARGDVASARVEDGERLLAELREARRQHRHDLRLLARCRERFAEINDDYRALLLRVEDAGLRAEADAAHAAAEAPDAEEAGP